MSTPKNTPLSHVDPAGHVRMVDVSDKAVTKRTAVASAVVSMRADVLDQLKSGKLKKGEALTTAKIAAINAAKMTGQLIPLCHTLPLQWVEVAFTDLDAGRLGITVTVRTTAHTGVEMEALTGASVAALTIYDMAKAADKSIAIGPIQLEHKSGGRTGEYDRSDAD